MNDREIAIQAYQRFLAKPLVGVSIEVIRRDFEKLEGLIDKGLLEFFRNSYTAALNQSGTPGDSEVFGSSESREYYGED